MSLTHVSTGSVVYASDFTAIRNQTVSVITDLYGFNNLESAAVYTGNTIQGEDWLHLYYDINRCWIHQTGTAIQTVLPQTGTSVLTAAFVNKLVDYANGIKTWYKNTVPGQQSSSTISTSTVIVAGANPDYTVTYSWLNNSDMNHFFNLGGRLAFNIKNSAAATNTNEVSLVGMLPAITTSSYTNLYYPSSHTYSYSSGTNSITLAYATGTSAITATVSISAGATVNLSISTSATVYYSTGSTQATDFYFGIPAARPSVTSSSGGGTVVKYKRLSVDPLTAFNCQAGTTTTSQIVTVRNVGNSTLTVSAIYFNSIGSVHHVNLSGDFGGPADFTGEPLIPKYILNQTYSVPLANQQINPGQNRTFTIAYTGLRAGTQTNQFTLVSDNDLGAVTTYTTVNVQTAKFNFDLSPLNILTTSTSLSTIDQKFSIIPRNGTYSVLGTWSNYTATVVASTASAFSLDSRPYDGPILSFKPANQPNGVYTATVSITVTGTNYYGEVATVAQTGTMVVNYQPPETVNLGTWVSALQNANGVVGMSYDKIAGRRYLTIGVGLGADGSAPYVDPAYVSVANLGINADSKYDQGPVLYPIYEYPSSPHSEFLKTYGSWIKSNDYTGDPQGVEVVRSYTFTVPSTETDTYNWTMSVDNYGFFTIDGAVIGDMRYDPYGYATTESGSISLPPGTHTIEIHIYNQPAATVPNPAGIAISLVRASDGRQVWSTLYPQRTAYLYWSEVYRILIDETVSTFYQSKDYIIKSIGPAVNGSWNPYFGQVGTAAEGSLFSVASSYGTLTVTFNENYRKTGDPTTDQTLMGLPFLSYYNSARGDRVTQLEDPQDDGTYTHQFLGFNLNGSLRLSGLVKIPTIVDPGYTDGNTGGGSIKPVPDTQLQ
jgi:hypothetical protein